MSPSRELFKNPLHPYTKALLSAILIPKVDGNPERIKLRGEVTSPIDPPDECRFVSVAITFAGLVNPGIRRS
jgi:peptide/nickel transport system ATP-binding protein